MKRARKIFVLMLSCIMLCGITQPIQAASPASLVTVRTDFSDTSVPYAVPVLQYAGTNTIFSDLPIHVQGNTMNSIIGRKVSGLIILKCNTSIKGVTICFGLKKLGMQKILCIKKPYIVY